MSSSIAKGLSKEEELEFFQVFNYFPEELGIFLSPRACMMTSPRALFKGGTRNFSKFRGLFTKEKLEFICFMSLFSPTPPSQLVFFDPH